MPNLTIQVHGNARRSSASYDVTGQAGDSATRKPNMSMDLNFYFSRSSESSSKMKVSVNGTLWRLCKYTSGSSASSYDDMQDKIESDKEEDKKDACDGKSISSFFKRLFE